MAGTGRPRNSGFVSLFSLNSSAQLTALLNDNTVVQSSPQQASEIRVSMPYKHNNKRNSTQKSQKRAHLFSFFSLPKNSTLSQSYIWYVNFQGKIEKQNVQYTSSKCLESFEN